MQNSFIRSPPSQSCRDLPRVAVAGGRGPGGSQGGGSVAPRPSQLQGLPWHRGASPGSSAQQHLQATRTRWGPRMLSDFFFFPPPSPASAASASQALLDHWLLPAPQQGRSKPGCHSEGGMDGCSLLQTQCFFGSSSQAIALPFLLQNKRGCVWLACVKLHIRSAGAGALLESGL